MSLTLITIFATSFVIALSGALMPGPLLTCTVAESTGGRASAGPLVIFGHGLLEIALVAALLAGLGPLLVRDDVFIFISLAGGAVLLWMGAGMLKSIPGLVLNRGDGGGSSSSRLMLLGVVLSLANPYWLIWWASIGLGYILHSMKYGLLGVAAFFTGHIMADLAWYSLVSIGVAKGQSILSDRTYRRLIGFCAVFLVGFSLWFFYGGIQRALAISQG